MYVYKSMRVSTIYVYIYIYIYIHTHYVHIAHTHTHIYIYICMYVYIYGGFLNWGYPQSIQVMVNHFGIETTMVTLGFTKVGPTLVSFAAACRKIHHVYSSLILAARKFHLARGFPSPCWMTPEGNQVCLVLIITPGTDGGETSFSWSTTVSSVPWLAGKSPPTNGAFYLVAHPT